LNLIKIEINQLKPATSIPGIFATEPLSPSSMHQHFDANPRNIITIVKSALTIVTIKYQQNNNCRNKITIVEIK
jgi:hypothetical protein